MKLSEYIAKQKQSLVEQLAVISQELAKSDALRLEKARLTKQVARLDQAIETVGDTESSSPEKILQLFLNTPAAGNGKVWTDEMREAASKAAKARLAAKPPATPAPALPLAVAPKSKAAVGKRRASVQG
jgi:hypothetical protein